MKRNTRYKKSDIDKIAATCSAPSVDVSIHWSRGPHCTAQLTSVDKKHLS